MITTETMQTKTPILLYLSTLAPSGRRSQHISLSGVVQHLCDGAFGLGDFPWHQMEPERDSFEGYRIIFVAPTYPNGIAVDSIYPVEATLLAQDPRPIPTLASKPNGVCRKEL